MIRIQNILRIAIYGRVRSNSNMLLLLYRPLLNETNERALLNAFSSNG